MEKLMQYLTRNRLSQKEFAATLGIGGGHLSAILNDRKLPSLRLAVRIEEVTRGRVKPRDFVS